jgi:asparagine synthase (glutamine-hydrolysing)
MAGICGFVGVTSAAESSALLADMLGRMNHHPWYVVDRSVDEAAGLALGRVSLGLVNTAAQPAANETGSLVAVLEGEVYDYSEQRQRLEVAGHRFAGTSHAELLAHGYEQEGLAFLRGLHGKFAAALWDGRARQLHLTCDRFGMKPLYYARPRGRLVFASSLGALLADPEVGRETDVRGLAQFFTFGQLLGEDTLVEGVRLVPAAGWLTYDAATDRLSGDRYWRLQARPTAGGDNAAALDRIDDALAKGVNRCVTGTDRLGLSLSGGLDARTILGIAGPGRSMSTLSLGMPGSMDHRSATEMARLLGYPHRQVALGEEFLGSFEQHLRQMVRLTDGQYLCQCIVMPTLPVYRELGIQVLLRGHAGELMHMTKAYNFSLDGEGLAIGSERELSGWLWKRLQAFMLEGTGGRLFAGAVRRDIEELARSSLADCLAETVRTEPHLHRVWHLFLNQRLRRETALSLVEFDSVVETRLPFLDNELIDALFAAPPELKLGDAIQSYVLRKHWPELLDVVNVNTGTRVGAGRLAKAVSKFRLRMLAKLGVPGYQPYERLGLWLRRELRPLVERLLLSDRCLGRGIFDPDGLRVVVDKHLNHKANHTYLLLALMIFETSQREFVDTPPSPGRLTRDVAAIGAT